MGGGAKDYVRASTIIIIIIINHACIAHITFREKSLCALRKKNTEGSKVKNGTGK